MTTAIEVRLVLATELPAVARVRVASWRASHAGLVPDPELAAIGEPARLDLWVERTAASTEVSTFVALLDGEVIGFAAYGAERSDLAAAEDGRGEVFALYVHPDDWGTGGGHALMPSARAALRARIRRCEHLGARGRRPRHRVLPAPGIRADR